jgi:hypothetical protein
MLALFSGLRRFDDPFLQFGERHLATVRDRGNAPPPRGSANLPSSRRSCHTSFGEVGLSFGGVIGIAPTTLPLRVPAVAGSLRNFLELSAVFAGFPVGSQTAPHSAT